MTTDLHGTWTYVLLFFFLHEVCDISAQFVDWHTFLNDVTVHKLLLCVIKYVLYFYVNTISDLLKCDIFVVVKFVTRALCFHQSKIKTKEVEVNKIAKNLLRQYEFNWAF